MGLRLGTKRAETDLADGKGGGVKQGSGTDAAIAGEERRDQVIEGAARDAVRLGLHRAERHLRPLGEARATCDSGFR